MNRWEKGSLWCSNPNPEPFQNRRLHLMNTSVHRLRVTSLVKRPCNASKEISPTRKGNCGYRQLHVNPSLPQPARTYARHLGLLPRFITRLTNSIFPRPHPSKIVFFFLPKNFMESYLLETPIAPPMGCRSSCLANLVQHRFVHAFSSHKVTQPEQRMRP